MRHRTFVSRPKATGRNVCPRMIAASAHLEDGQRNEVKDGREDDLNNGNNEASMNNKLRKLCTSLVAVPAVPQQQTPQVAKLGQ